MPILTFLGDVHNQDNAITTSLTDSGIDLQGKTYALFLEEIMGNIDDTHIMLYEYPETINIICKDLSTNAIDRITLLSLMNNSNNNVYAFDAAGPPESLKRHNGQRANINQLLGVNRMAQLDFVIVIDGAGHLEQNPNVQGWVPLQNVPPNYPNVNQIKLRMPD